MGTKMKGLLRGLRYISQIFDEEEEKQPELEIGFPTDVKHVAHIGWNGPTVDPPSWMKDFKEEPEDLSGPTAISGGSRDPQRPSQGSRSSSGGGSKPSRLQNSPSKGETEQTRSRDLLLGEGSTSCPLQLKEDSSSAAKPKRNSSSTTSSTRTTRRSKDKDTGLGPGPVLGLDPSSESPSRSLPEIPKKLRRKKKPKEETGNASSRSSRTKGGGEAALSLYSDPGPNTEPGSGSEFAARNSSLRPFRKDGRQ